MGEQVQQFSQQDEGSHYSRSLSSCSRLRPGAKGRGIPTVSFRRNAPERRQECGSQEKEKGKRKEAEGCWQGKRKEAVESSCKFNDANTAAKALKDKCFKSDTPGSFGDCSGALKKASGKIGKCGLGVGTGAVGTTTKSARTLRRLAFHKF